VQTFIQHTLSADTQVHSRCQWNHEIICLQCYDDTVDSAPGTTAGLHQNLVVSTLKGISLVFPTVTSC